MPTFHLRPPIIAADRDRSFWLQDIGARSATLPLAADAETDVAIIGGGYCGLWTALRLREHDPRLRITVLEADICGGGASGRNGGQVHSWFAEIDTLARLVGPQEALTLCRDTADAIDELQALQDSGQVDMQLRLDGWIWTASARAQEGAWEAAAAMGAAAGEARLLTLTREQIRSRSGTDTSYQGVVEPRAGTVHPARLAQGLRDLAIRRGVTVHEGTAVTGLEAAETCVLRTPAATLRAGKVVLATNAWATAIPELRRYLYIVASQVIATAAVPARLDALGLTGGESFCDSQAQVLYWQRTPEGRLIFGRGSGTIAYAERVGATFNRDSRGAADNQRELARVYPALANVPAAFDWTGPIDCTAEHLPVFGTLEGAPNVFFGVGFNGTGIAQTPVAGRILASLVLGRDDRFGHSGLIGLARRTALPPAPIRYLGARIVRQAIRIRNDAEIRNRQPNPVIRRISDMRPGR